MLLLALSILLVVTLGLSLFLFLIAKALGGKNIGFLKSLELILIYVIASIVLNLIFVPLHLSFVSFIGSFVLYFWLLKKFFDLNIGKAILVYIGQFIGIIILAIVIRFTLLAPFIEPVSISGTSMEPTYKSGAYLLINKIDKNYNQNDIVAYTPPPQPYLPASTNQLIDRVVGLPGETIEVSEAGKVTKNGKELTETFTTTGQAGTGTLSSKPVTLASDEYFLLCDNRAKACLDSRTFGPVKATNIIGKVWYKVY